MKFIIYGAGGIGGSIGARLHLIGLEVILIARGAHYEKIKANGLEFHSPVHHETLNITAVDHPNKVSFGSNDVVILCMKTQHVEGALRDLQLATSDDIAVVCCQNGVTSERMATRRFKRVYGMVVWVPAEHLNPGEVVNFANDRAGTLDLGCFPSGTDQACSKIASALQDAGFVSKPDPDIMRHKYAKLLVNLTNVLDASTNERVLEFIEVIQEEARACFKAAGITWADTNETRVRRTGIHGAPVAGFERHGSSTLQSLLRTTGDIEADYMNGEIVQLGRLHSIPTPANTLAQRIGIELVRGTLKPRSMSRDQLLSRWERYQNQTH